MTITAQGSIVGWGLNAGGVKDGLVTDWYRHRVNLATLGPITEKQVFPPEIGGPNNPTGAFKSGAFYAGRVSFNPRLTNVFGNILLSAFGSCETTLDSPVATVNSHLFSQLPTNPLFVPWMGWRRHIPGNTTAEDLGDIGKDCKISAVTFNFPQVGYPIIDVDVLGRIPSLDEQPDTWTWSNATEPAESVPMVMKGTGITLDAINGGVAIPVTNVRITWDNGMTTIGEERIQGSYYPDDFATRQRTAIIEMTYKWRDPELCRFIFNSSNLDETINDFVPCIDFTDFNYVVETPCDISGLVTEPWRMKFSAGKVDWQQGPLQLAGDDIIMVDYIGTALETDDVADVDKSQNYFNVAIENQTAGYTVPVPV